MLQGGGELMILSSKSLTIEQFVPSEKFKDNYDRIFGKKPTILSWEDEDDIVTPEVNNVVEEDPNGSPG
jgi:hypothetical protein